MSQVNKNLNKTFQGGSLGSTLKNLLKSSVLTIVDKVVPPYDSKHVAQLEAKLSKEKQEYESAAATEIAKLGTAAATIGTNIITKVKDDPEFRENAQKLGYTVVDTTKEGIYFAFKNAHKFKKPALKLAKNGISLLFVPVKVLGILALNIALTAASVIPPVAVAIRLAKTAIKLTGQAVRGVNLAGKVASSSLELSNTILQLILDSSNVIPLIIKEVKKIKKQASQLIESTTGSAINIAGEVNKLDPLVKANATKGGKTRRRKSRKSRKSKTKKRKTKKR